MDDLHTTETPMLHAMLVTAQVNRNQHQSMVEQYDHEAYAIRAELNRRMVSDVMREFMADHRRVGWEDA